MYVPLIFLSLTYYPSFDIVEVTITLHIIYNFFLLEKFIRKWLFTLNSQQSTPIIPWHSQLIKTFTPCIPAPMALTLSFTIHITPILILTRITPLIKQELIERNQPIQMMICVKKLFNRNKEGFVSLKLISSFKRVKHLSKDWRQVAEAIERKSDKLEVNDLKTKVRRLAELPEYDETTPSRTVVALNLPLERPTIEGVAEIFSKVGDIVLIRILRPGNPIPADIKPFVNKHPEMIAKVTALVEFERTEFALRAVKDLSTGEDVEDGMKVMELIPAPSKSQKNKKAESKASKQVSNNSGTIPTRRSSYAGQQHQNQNQAFTNGNTIRNRRISLYHNMKFEEMPNQMTDNHGNKPGLNPNAPTFQMQRRISRPHMIHPFEMLQMQHQQVAAAAMAAMHSPASPWLQRRMMNEVASSGLALPPNVVRLPRGPTKGTKGFHNWCRSRMTSSPPATSVSPIVGVEIQDEIVEEDSKSELVASTSNESPPPPPQSQLQTEQALLPPLPRIIIDNTNEDDDDSGNEDDGFSDPDERRQGEFNERTR
ncbi:LARP6 [Lepeophtheirus salmonis]|uniref:LARP6 n=1 Tax=Lepeophtheirus salmonis TaxID=72036 RepID=A0A7R8CWY5_LEPSM|nr:LARP6 [Lepeophtheirus salmonis]CAF2925863.1 LARP6 [Lepeophtheirus salmonis]